MGLKLINTLQGRYYHIFLYLLEFIIYLEVSIAFHILDVQQFIKFFIQTIFYLLLQQF